MDPFREDGDGGIDVHVRRDPDAGLSEAEISCCSSLFLLCHQDGDSAVDHRAAIGEWLGAQSGLGYFSRRMMTQLDGAGVFAPYCCSR